MYEVPGSIFTPKRKSFSYVFCLLCKLLYVLWLLPRPFAPPEVGLTPLLATLL